MSKRRPPSNPPPNEGQDSFNWDAPPPPDPPKLIDPKLTRAVTKDAIRRAEHLTTDEKKREYFEAVYRCALRSPIITADMVWQELGRVGDGQRDDGSGLGPVMIAAAKAGYIQKIQLVRSERPVSHGKGLTQWKSLIFQGSISTKTN